MGIRCTHIIQIQRISSAYAIYNKTANNEMWYKYLLCILFFPLWLFSFKFIFLSPRYTVYLTLVWHMELLMHYRFDHLFFSISSHRHHNEYILYFKRGEKKYCRYMGCFFFAICFFFPLRLLWTIFFMFLFWDVGFSVWQVWTCFHCFQHSQETGELPGLF